MTKLLAKALALLLSLCLVPYSALPAYAQAPAQQQAGEVTAQIPQAQVARPAETLPAAAGLAVLWNDLVETAPGGRVRLTLLDGSILNVGSRSSLRVVQHDAQTRQSDLTLTFGKLRSRLRAPRRGERFEIRTNTAVLGVIGTDFFVEATATSTRVIVYEGIVLVQNINAAIVGAVQARAGQQVEVLVDQPPSAPQPVEPSQLQDSVQETNVGQALPPPQPPIGPTPLVTKLIWVGVIAGVAAIAIATPIAASERHRARGCSVPAPACP